MTIVRNARRSKYVVVDKTTAEDKGLSAKAVGWLLRVLAKPEDWSVSIRQFAREYGVGLDAVRTAFAELERAGYILRLRYQTPTGTFDWEYRVFEAKQDAIAAREELGDLVGEQKRSGGPRRRDQDRQPRSENPNMDQPCSGSPYTDQPNTDHPYTENPTTTKEGLSKDGPPKTVHQESPPSPDGLTPSLFQADDLPHGSPESHGAPTPPTPPPPPPSQNGQASKAAETARIVQRVFEAWQRATGHPGAKLTDARRRKVTARLREGYTAEEILLAVTEGWRHDPWRERADNNDLVILLRDGPQLEKFLKLARKAKGNGSGAADPDEELRRAREFAEQEDARLQAARYPNLNPGATA
jgi:DNA-binding transcriptional regulator YhcF (GntR family)